MGEPSHRTRSASRAVSSTRKRGAGGLDPQSLAFSPDNCVVSNPMMPDSPNGTADDSEVFSIYRPMALQASHTDKNVLAGYFLIQFRHQALGPVSGRCGRTAVEVGSERDEAGPCELITVAFEEVL